MADLHFVDSALIPKPVRKEKQFRLPYYFSEFDFTQYFPTDGQAAFGFPSISRVFTDCRDTVLHCTVICKMFLYTSVKQEISTLRTTGAWLRQTEALGQSTTTRVYHRLRADCSQVNLNIIFFLTFPWNPPTLPPFLLLLHKLSKHNLKFLRYWWGYALRNEDGSFGLHEILGR